LEHELRQRALWYVEFVLLRFQDYRDEYLVRHRAGDVGDVVPVAVGGDARLSPSNYAYGRTGVKRRDPVLAQPSGDGIAVVPHL
jgi:hypothetical protein